MNCRRRIETQTQDNVEKQQEEFMDFVQDLKLRAIAEYTTEANEQHYEVPTAFFQLVLGKHMKYSCAYWQKSNNLDEADTAMLELTCKRAQLADGQRILECGCGWGSLSLYMAAKYPNSRIMAVSNSTSQREYIEKCASNRGLSNLEVVTADMNEFVIQEQFDRILTVEMFEHMRNYQLLLEKLSYMLNESGKLFVHMFVHKQLGYLYEIHDESDWMAKYFFTGGTMPSNHLLFYFSEHLRIQEHWQVEGTHYSKTAEAWLSNMESNKPAVMQLFGTTYGKRNALRWWVRWRVFFMACSELWKYNSGTEWFVSHYLFERTRVQSMSSALSAGFYI